jgi:ADP-ribose pyrophosphatase YjhB (NUDIX family)
MAPAQRQRVGAYVAAVSGDRLLLCRMSERTKTPGRWTLPGGGLNHGEDPEVAALRELAEETGLRGVIDDIVGVHTNIYTVDGSGSIHGIRLIYRASVDGALRDERGGSTDRAQWFRRDDLGAIELSDHAEYAVSRLTW